MKNNKIIIIVFLIAFFCFTKTSNVFAQPDSFTDVLKLLGIDDSVNSVTESQHKQTSVSLEFPSSQNLLIKSSQLAFQTTDTLLQYKKVFLICDLPFSLENISCDYAQVNSSEQDKILFYKEPSSEYFIARTTLAETELYVIPEQYILVPKLNTNLARVFQAESYAQESLKRYYETDEALKTESIPRNPKQSIISELSKYVVVGTTVLGSLFYVILFFLRIRKSLLKTDTYLVLYQHLFNLYKKNIINLFLINVFTLVLTLIFLSTISYIDKGTIDFSYIYNFVIETFSKTANRNTGTLVLQQAHFALIFMVLANILVLVLLTFPYVFHKMLTNSSQLLQRGLSTATYKILLFLLTSFILILSVIDQYFSNSLALLIFLLCFLLLLIANGLKNTVNFKTLYSFQEKITLLAIVIILTFISIYKNVGLKKVPPHNEDLIGISSPIIKLPYYKTVGPNVLFNEYKLKLDHGLYLDHIKVFDTRYKIIKNKPLSEFIDKGAWEVVIVDEQGFPKNIISHKPIIDALSSSTGGQYVLISRDDPTDTFELELSFDCNNETNFEVIDSTIFYANNTSKEQELFYFPGCLNNQTDNIRTYRFPIYLKETPYSVIKINNFDNLSIRKVNLYKNNNIVNKAFLKYPHNHPLVAKGLNGSAELHVYNIDIDNELIISRSSSAIDLGLIASNLLKQNEIVGSFLIWSDNKSVFLKNEIETDFSDD